MIEKGEIVADGDYTSLIVNNKFFKDFAENLDIKNDSSEFSNDDNLNSNL